ncbi:MAG: MaoC family dehydratase N-terminal domain-containing protein [Alphaproteobacteria bacterium]|uniref:MaoC family dehydratase N-terminal domain-containing protein n=1 Tax=Futiania mangrovi TaxID=2959716 RepID=A0A9J6PDF4_9PROT|nr:MaoC family dehydratase N-terminal domain-containing protein [Futiania mangrovii]MCP1336657.1 MaoC family dehydratase N-terminal domain-containing protein [Futiania mangrovii]MDX5360943.1 MaoC family dehydratase N-terminal domain-containing protein [Alphaproteobacteria bacterium]MDX5369103.1 MaoC family dehydratase N-terminal domain-containing protein [Alphaproteobacteria bacterium]MDX5463796.1 MaoC family dehydratase N-terminal domain-containing protein [Alphaproteobacteria bacterium]
MTDEPKLLGEGYYWNELKPGMRFRTFGRTITEADLVSFINCTGMVEVLFTNEEFRKSHSAIKGRVVPGAFIYAIAEGLVLTGMGQATGLAFLHTDMDVKAPTVVGDTVHVEIEVTEARAASKGNRGLVRTKNRIVNQRGETVIEYSPLRLMQGR